MLKKLAVALLLATTPVAAHPVEDFTLATQAFNIIYNLRTGVTAQCNNWKKLVQAGTPYASLVAGVMEAGQNWLALANRIKVALDDPVNGPKLVNGIGYVASGISPAAVVTEINRTLQALNDFNNADKTTAANGNAACAAVMQALPAFASIYQ